MGANQTSHFKSMFPLKLQCTISAMSQRASQATNDKKYTDGDDKGPTPAEKLHGEIITINKNQMEKTFS